MDTTTYDQLTIENAAAAKMPAGLLYADRCRWIAKRDQLVRASQARPAAPVVEPAASQAPSRAAVAAALLAARAACAADRRWLAAANKAAVELDTGAWAWNGSTLVVRSRTTAGRQYRCTATTCECPAYAKSTPCWHRAAARLIERAAQPAQAAA